MSLYAYADPVYLGCGKLYPEHPESHLWDDPETHRYLIACLLDQYPDGWALSLSAPSLATLLPMCPDDARVCSWVKPFASFKPNVNPAFTWEPVIVYGGRRHRSRSELTVKDHIIAEVSTAPTLAELMAREDDALAESITLRKGLTGAKPVRFCEWVLDMLGFEPGDELHDLFPGTGIMGEVVAKRLGAETFSAETLFGGAA